MAIYVKGEAVENATSYELYEKVVNEATSAGTQLLSDVSTNYHENLAASASSSTMVARTEYYSYSGIPITAGHSYKIPFGRRLWTFDSSGNPLRTLSLYTDVDDYTFTAADGEVSCSIAIQYADCTAASATITDLSGSTETTESYNLLSEAEELNFNVTALGLASGDHTLVVKAKADGFEDSEYSNEVTYTAT